MNDTKDEKIDLFLSFLKDELETMGSTPSTCTFDFNNNGEDFLAFRAKSNLSEEEIYKLINICHSRKYVEYAYISSGKVIKLTTGGQGRAISTEAAANYKEKPQQHSVNIGIINGATQIGNNNTQNFKNIFEYLINEIEKNNSSPEEIKEAKSLLKKALEHPITSSVIGASVGALIAILGGTK